MSKIVSVEVMLKHEAPPEPWWKEPIDIPAWAAEEAVPSEDGATYPFMTAPTPRWFWRNAHEAVASFGLGRAPKINRFSIARVIDAQGASMHIQCWFVWFSIAFEGSADQRKGRLDRLLSSKAASI